MNADFVDDGNGSLTLGKLKAFAEQHGLGDNTVIYVEREDRDLETGGPSVYDDPAVGARATMFTSGHDGRLVICIDAVDIG
jgi:hypothetical protein